MMHDGFFVEDPASDLWSPLELQMLLVLAVLQLFSSVFAWTQSHRLTTVTSWVSL